MVVDDFNEVRAVRCPGKADPELVVDSDAVLPLPVSLQPLETIPGRHAQILEGLSGVQRVKFPSSQSMQLKRETFASCFGGATVVDVLSRLVCEGLDHAES